MCVCLCIVHCGLYRDSESDGLPTVPATPPAAWMVGLIVIDNQPIYGPCVTAEFSATDEVELCGCECVVRVGGGWGVVGGVGDLGVTWSVKIILL